MVLPWYTGSKLQVFALEQVVLTVLHWSLAFFLLGYSTDVSYSVCVPARQCTPGHPF